MGQLITIRTNKPRKLAVKALRSPQHSKVDVAYSYVDNAAADVRKQCKGRVVRYGTSFYFVEHSDALLIKLRYGK
jgi:hypothetical protein